jgi:MYND finger
MEKSEITPIQALYFADACISKKDYIGSCPWLIHVINDPSSDSYTLKRAARLFAEINSALPNNDKRKQSPAAVQLLLFSRVRPSEWLGTQGVAATMLKKESTILGDVRLNYQTLEPILIQGEDYCDACNKPFASKRCKQCGLTYYCDQECQKDDWKFHKWQCAKNALMGDTNWNSTQPYIEKLESLRKSIKEAL